MNKVIMCSCIYWTYNNYYALVGILYTQKLRQLEEIYVGQINEVILTDSGVEDKLEILWNSFNKAVDLEITLYQWLGKE